MEKEETPICAKTGIVMPLLIFKILCTNSGGFFFYFSINCHVLFQK
jgi:hypothetical protein